MFRTRKYRRARFHAPEEAFVAVGLPKGRCLGSKSRYRDLHRRHFFVPNAYVFCRSAGLIWWGDLDLWVDARKTERVARMLRQRLYVLPEDRAARDAATVPFPEAQRRAVWHTGGLVRPDRRLIQRSGLDPHTLAFLVGVTRQRLSRLQRPYVVQQINQRLHELGNFFGPLTRHFGFRRWGDWFHAPHPALKQRSPLEVLRAEGTITPRELFAEIYSNEELLARYYSTVMGGLTLSIVAPIRTRWPIVERRHSRIP